MIRSLVKTCTAIAVFVMALAAALAGCLEDLPAALRCPPQEVVEATNCGAVFAIEERGCITFKPGGKEALECLTGPRPNCDCVPDECVAPPESCFPNDNCPTAVADDVGKNAKCSQLASVDFSPINGLVQASQCVCGCMACAAVCDGKGPVIGIVNRGMPQEFVSSVIKVSDRLPSRGKFGFYLRSRGYSNAAVYVIVGDVEVEDPRIVAAYYVSTTIQKFGEDVYFDDQNYAPGFEGQAYEWSSEEEKPTYLVIVPPGPGPNDPIPVHSAWEIDCLIPFTVS